MIIIYNQIYGLVLIPFITMEILCCDCLFASKLPCVQGMAGVNTYWQHEGLNAGTAALHSTAHTSRN